MFLHNKLVIEKGGKEYESFNTTLFSLAKCLTEFRAYATHIAIGSGVSETNMGMLTLENFLRVLPLTTVDSNFNPANGTLFVTKQVKIDASDPTPLEVAEVGLTGEPDSDNPSIANRFLVNDGNIVYRDAGEEMTITVSVYLDSAIGNGLVLTGGENPFVKLLLGEGTDREDNVFEIAKGNDQTPNSTIITRSAEGLLTYPVDINIRLAGRASIYTISCDIGRGVVNELLLLFNGSVVARQNVSEISGVQSGLVSSFTADGDNVVSVNISGVKEVTKVVDESTSTEITDYNIKKFGTSFEDGLWQRFSDVGITADHLRVISKQGDKIGFVKDNTMYIYDTTSGDLVPYDTSAVDTTGGYLFVLYENNLFVKYVVDGTHGVRLYNKGTGSTYLARSYNLNSTYYEGANRTDEWRSLDMIDVGTVDAPIKAVVLTGGNWVFYYKTRSNDGGDLFQSSTNYSNLFGKTYARAMERTNRCDFFIAGYDMKQDRMYYTSSSRSFHTVDDEIATRIVREHELNGYPKMAKNAIFRPDYEAGQLLLYSFDTFTSSTIDFGQALKVATSYDLDYMAVLESDEKVRVFYIDGNYNATEFSDPVVADGYKIKDLEFVGDFLLLFTEDNRVYSKKINKDKFAIYSIEKGSGVQITYSADKTPGAGNSSVKANVRLLVTLS